MIVSCLSNYIRSMCQGALEEPLVGLSRTYFPRHVLWLTPWACARVRVLQWVASGGVVGRVASSMARTFRGDRRWALGPCGASSDRPDGPAPLNRFRHSSTVGREVSTRCAIALLASPSAASRQIRDRSTTLWGLIFARIHASNVCLSSPVIGNESVVSTYSEIPDPTHTGKILLIHYTNFGCQGTHSVEGSLENAREAATSSTSS